VMIWDTGNAKQWSFCCCKIYYTR